MRLVALFILLAGCAPPVQQELLIISELEVTDVVDGLGLLELEVHIYELTGDAGTERHLGCAGNDSGLEQVDARDTRFRPEAFFVTSNGTQALETEDLRAERFRLVVTEDDAAPCPVEQNATGGAVSGRQDDLVGKSAAIDRADLSAGVSLSFDKVVRIKTTTKIDG